MPRIAIHLATLRRAADGSIPWQEGTLCLQCGGTNAHAHCDPCDAVIPDGATTCLPCADAPPVGCGDSCSCQGSRRVGS